MSYILTPTGRRYLREETEVDLDEDASNFKSAVARIKKAKSAKDLKKLEKSFERVYKQTGALTDKEFGQLDDMISDKLVKLDEGLGVAKDIPAMEVGTDRYREYAVGLTPGENAEFAAAKDFKVASMKEALAKVWGLDEKALDKSPKEGYDEEDEELKPVKGSKTMTGGKIAKVDTKPKLD